MAQCAWFHFGLRHLGSGFVSPRAHVKGERLTVGYRRRLCRVVVAVRLGVSGLRARRSDFDIEGASRPVVVPVPQTGVARTLNLSEELFPDQRQQIDKTQRRGNKRQQREGMK